MIDVLYITDLQKIIQTLIDHLQNIVEKQIFKSNYNNLIFDQNENSIEIELLKMELGILGKDEKVAEMDAKIEEWQILFGKLKKYDNATKYGQLLGELLAYFKELSVWIIQE